MALAATGGLLATPGVTHATPPFVVNDIGDAPDASPGDGFCKTAASVCTLRAAIQEANALAGDDSIQFALGPGVPSIAPTSPLPTITESVGILGNTGGATRVELNGASAGPLANGLTIAGDAGVYWMVINRFSANGIDIAATASQPDVRHNYIGTDATGSTASPNGAGILIENGSALVIDDVISGNAGEGIYISPAPVCPTLLQLFVASSTIGLNVAGTSGVSNGGAGVWVEGCRVAIGSNTISGNAGDGIHASANVNDSYFGCNVVGLNAAGTSVIGNGGQGITVGGIGNLIKGNDALCPVVRPNVVSGQVNGQIFLGTLSKNNVITGNYIGTDITGNVGLGIGGTGVVDTGTNNTIGGFGVGEGNVISGNAGGGVRLGVAVTGSLIAGNEIGIGADGLTAIGNGVGGPGAGAGIYVQGSNGMISANTIADNYSDGILQNAGTGNTFDSNSIFNNFGLGINLMGSAGADANDTGDGDSGPNNLQNYPVITSSATSGVASVINGTLNSTPSSQFYVTFFTSPSCDGTGFGEGQTPVAGYVNVTTDGAGNGTFAFTTGGALTVGQVVTATAFASSTSDTSEFSACSTIAACTAGDNDCDGFVDIAPTSHQSPANTNVAKDNCPGFYNDTQLNNDGNFFDNSPPYAVAADDKTNVNSDALGNDCDPDNDNDGLNDGAELFGGCGTSTGSLNPLNADTDGDRVTDGAECVLGSDPFLASSKPAIPSAANDPDHDQLSTAFETSIGTNPNNNDTDGDGLQDGWEYKGHGSDPTKTDTDVDGVTDGCEVASLNGDSTVNSGDQGLLGAEITRAVPPSAKLPNFDLNKDGTINSGDQGIQSTKVGPGKCPAVIPWP
jgi:CSLREA domain-containing protein